MLTINARGLNFFLKYCIKPLQGPLPLTPGILRGMGALLNGAGRLTFYTPSHIAIQSVYQKGPSGMVKGEWVISDGITDHDNAILYLHGGGYFFGSPYTHRPLTWRLSRNSRTRVFSLDYRLIPEHTVADCCADAVNAYQWLLAKGHAPEKLIIGGDSAGGGLTLLTLMALKNRGITLPRAAFCLSPFADMTRTSPTLTSNARHSYMFHKNFVNKLEAFLTLETGNGRDPEISPAFGDFKGLPPLYFQVADTELLFHDTLLAVKNARSAGVEVELDLWHNLPHVFTLFSDVLPEGRQGIRNIADFVSRRMLPA